MTKNERKIAEAIRRLRWLVTNKELCSCVADEFEEDNQVYYSENGILFYADAVGGCPDFVLDKMKELNEKGNIVYHITHEYLNFGECWDFWLITDEDIDKESKAWMFDDFKDGIVFAYVYNATDPIYSEYGSIGYRVICGGCKRNA